MATSSKEDKKEKARALINGTPARYYLYFTLMDWRVFVTVEFYFYAKVYFHYIFIEALSNANIQLILHITLTWKHMNAGGNRRTSTYTVGLLNDQPIRGFYFH